MPLYKKSTSMNFKILVLLSIIITSCGEKPFIKKENTETKIDESEFLNHEIINDSIVVRIKEFNERKYTYRNLCVFKNNEIYREHLIYKITKQKILDDGYNKTKKKEYTVKSKSLIAIIDYTFHYFDYDIDHIDTAYSQVMVLANGELSLIK